MCRYLWIIAYLVVIASCSSTNEQLHYSYQLETGPHLVPVTLNFEPDSGYYWGTYFNKYYGTYSLGKRKGYQTITFGPVNTTAISRPGRLLKYERAYYDTLYGVHYLTLTKEKLILQNSRNHILTFKTVD